MQKLGLNQTLQQKLSPQQIQFIKLLQIPTAELESRIEEELEINPALEEGKEDYSSEESQSESEYDQEDGEGDGDNYNDDELSVEDYIRDDDISGYKMVGDGPSEDDDKEMPIASGSTLADSLISQLGFLKLDERQTNIGRQLIGSIDSDGYIRRELEQIVDDLAFGQNIETNAEEIEKYFFRIQQFDPAGIGARSLQECLILQLERKDDTDPTVEVALKIVEENFEEFTKKHYDKIQKRLDIDDDLMKQAIHLITKLNPKPGGGAVDDVKTQYIIPDFILVNNHGKLELSLNSRNAPELRISRSYTEMFDTYDKSSKKDKN